MRVSLLVAVACACVASAADASAQETVISPITPSELQAIAGGQVLVETEPGSVSRGQVIGFVNAPASEVTAVIRDSGNHPRWLPEVDTTSGGHTGTTHGTTNVPLLRDRYWRLDETHRTANFDGVECDVVTYEYDRSYDDGNMEELYGYWLVCPLNEGAAVKYVVHADIGAPVPRALISWAQNRMLPGIIELLEERVGSRE